MSSGNNCGPAIATRWLPVESGSRGAGVSTDGYRAQQEAAILEWLENYADSVAYGRPRDGAATALMSRDLLSRALQWARLMI